MDATEPVDMGIVSLEDLLLQATEAFAGERTFDYFINGRQVRFSYTITPDASLLLGVRSRAAELVKLKPEALLPAWKPYVKQGISGDLATRIAWAEQTKVRLGESLLGTLDLLKLSAGAGMLFVLLTEDIAVAATGVLRQGEAEVIERLGEDSPATITG